MRSFIAIDLPEEVKKELNANFLRQLRAMTFRMSVIKPEGIHLTLKFLGDVEPEMLDSINKALTPLLLKLQPFELRLKEQGYFGSRSCPKVLWIGLNGELESLKNLVETVEKTVCSMGFNPEERKFSPHVTIARVKERKPCRGLVEYFSSLNVPQLAFNISSVYIKRSILQPTGAVYKTFYELSLGR